MYGGTNGQLHTEMINVSGWNLAADEEEDNDSEPPAKKPALTSEEDDFDLLFGQKKIQRQRDRYKVIIISSICKMNWTDTLRKLKSISEKMIHCCGGEIMRPTFLP